MADETVETREAYDPSDPKNFGGAKYSAWWTARDRGESPGLLVNQDVEVQRPHHDELVSRIRDVARAYGAEQALFAPPDSGRSYVGRYRSEFSPTSTFASIIDTLLSEIYRQQMIPTFVTSRASWRMQRLARDASDFCVGVEHEAGAEMLDLLWGLHALLFGVAICKGVETQNKRIGLEVVPRWELRIDWLEARYRDPRTILHRYTIDRGKLWDMYGHEDAEGLVGTKARRRKVIEGAVRVREDWEDEARLSRSDMVTVTEAWHLPSGPGADDGRMVLTTSGDQEDPTLLEIPYDCPKHRFRFHWLSPPLVGIDGDSVAARLLPNHRELAYLDAVLRDGHAQLSHARLFARTGAIPTLEHIQDIDGTILVGSEKPEALQLTPFGADFYGYRQSIKTEMQENAGINELSMRGQLPPGLQDASGTALQTYADFQSIRHAPKHKMRAIFTCERASLIMQMAEEISEREGSYEIKIADKYEMRELDWNDLREAKDAFVLKCFSTAGLAKTPTAQLDYLTKLLDKGIIDVFTFKRSLDSMDLQSNVDLVTGSYDILLDLLDKMIERGEYTSPEALDDWQMAIKLGKSFYGMVRRCEDVSPERKAMVRQFVIEAQMLQKAVEAPAPEMSPGAAAPASPPNGAAAPGGLPPEGMPPMPPMPTGQA